MTKPYYDMYENNANISSNMNNKHIYNKCGAILFSENTFSNLKIYIFRRGKTKRHKSFGRKKKRIVYKLNKFKCFLAFVILRILKAIVSTLYNLNWRNPDIFCIFSLQFEPHNKRLCLCNDYFFADDSLVCGVAQC